VYAVVALEKEVVENVIVMQDAKNIKIAAQIILKSVRNQSQIQNQKIALKMNMQIANNKNAVHQVCHVLI
jgi:hypothetical protein